MSRSLLRRTYALIPILPLLLAGCQEIAAPFAGPKPQFAQGVNGVWTVNTLGDAGDGVCDDTECTLREAIASATTGGRIGFAAGLHGSILLQAGRLEIFGKVLDIDGGSRITVDGQQQSGVFLVHANPLLPGAGGLNLTGMTVTNGSDFAGGGIIVANTARLTLDHVTVTGNSAASAGGGVSVHLAQATIRNSIISGNAATTGGGGIVVSGELTLIDSTIDDNRTDGDGGGIFNGQGSSIDVSGSTISNNDADFGGGIDNQGNARIVLSTISGNQATGSAGILNLGDLFLQSMTITRNDATQGVGGILASGPTNVVNSIIAGNRTSGMNTPHECQEFNSAFGSLGYNLTTDLVSCGFTGVGDVLVGSQLVSQVLEDQLKDNGGPTMTHALVGRGPAVDAGYCPGETTDQRGTTRPVDDPVMPNAREACDIGAYELQGPVVAVADLIVSQSVDRTSVKQGELLTYSVRVRNLGPQTAPNAVATNTLSSGVTFVEARLTKGTHTGPPAGETGVVTWYVGDMLDQDNEVAEIKVTVLVKGKSTITNTASAAGDVADPNAANNTAAITVTVAPGGGGNAGKKK